MNNTTLITQASKGGVANAIDYLRATEYYTDGSGERHDLQEWGGSWAPKLGVAGKPVERDAMDKLAQGFHPKTGEALCQNAGAKPSMIPSMRFNEKGEKVPRLDANGNPVMIQRGGHRIGYDITLSAPKDFSLAFAMADEAERSKILEVQKQANRRAMEYLEEHVETRRGHAGKDCIDASLVWSSHLHLAGRPVEVDGELVNDASIHTHNLVYGVALGDDGKSSTWESQQIFELRKASDGVYKNELYAGMRQLGYKLHQEEIKDDFGEITGKETRLAGLDQDTLDRYSKRQTEILDYQRETGVDHETAWAQTRKQKEEPGYKEMSKIWKKDFEAWEKEHGVKMSTEHLKAQEEHIIQAENPEQTIKRLHEHEALLDEHHLMEAMAEQHMGTSENLGVNVHELKIDGHLQKCSPRRIHEDDASPTGKNPRKYRQSRYAADWMIEREKGIAEETTKRMEDHGAALKPEHIQKSIEKFQTKKGFEMSEEQRSAVERLCSGGNLDVMTGWAGSGKTTVSEAYIGAYEDAGYQTLGCAPSWAAAKKLEKETGMKSYAVASLLQMMENGKSPIASNKCLIVMDEAGMVGTEDTQRLLAATSKEHPPKIVLQGDARQIQPVGAGAGMRLIAAKTGDAKLTEIRRQKHQDAKIQKERRELAGQFYEGAKEGPQSRADIMTRGQNLSQAFSASGMVDERNTRDEARQALVQDWASSSKPLEERMILGHTNADVDWLNQAARTELKAQGKIGQEDFEVMTSRRGQRVPQKFSVGDAIKFGKKDKAMGVVNNTTGKIKDLQHGKDGAVNFRVAIDGENRDVNFSSEDYSSIKPTYARTIHDAQGQGSSEVYHLAHQGMLDNQSALVAYTRLTDGDYTMYSDSATMEVIESRLGMDRLKENAIQEGQWQEQAQEEVSKVQQEPVAQGQQNPVQEEQKKEQSIDDFNRMADNDMEQAR